MKKGPTPAGSLAFACLLLVPAILTAQSVNVDPGGFVGITTGVPPTYTGQYVLQMTDFGFFWLDTVALRGGHVQAISSCAPGFPSSDSGFYVVGDCESITEVRSNGSVVLVLSTSGQCGAMTRGCGGPRDDGHWLFAFGLGTWEYQGDGVVIPESTQTADPLGRSWNILPTDATGTHFVWHSSGIPSSPPFADAVGINLSAVERSDTATYYGDRWQLRDFSSGAASVLWDFNYTGSFAADETGPEAAEGTVIGYFPCDPGGAVHGDIRSGANCRQSLGLASPPASGSYRFALRSSNSFGTSTNTYSSAALPVACPQVIIAGYTGSTGTCARTGGTLTLPTGGNADASHSKGNLTQASFDWTFRFSSGPPAGASGAVVPVPNGAVGFALAITFPGGYQATAASAVSLTSSLVAAFSTQNPVVRGSSFILANEMVKATTTTLDSVDSLILPGACGAPPPIPMNPLAATFLAEGGVAAVTAPASVGSYCVSLRYNYTEGGAPASQIVSRPLTVIDWTAVPSIGIYLDGAKMQPAAFFGGTYFLSAGTDYYLFDEEPAPPAGTPYPGAQWTVSSPSGHTAVGSTATQMLGPVQFPKVCAAGCSLKLAVAAATRQVPVNVASCASNATSLCLNGGRFSIHAAWSTTDGRSGEGQAVGVTGDTGIFWFFSSGNVEMIVKIVDGRAVNSRFWLFAGGLTDVDVVMTVLDTQTGSSRIYHNPQGHAFQPIQDTGTFLASAVFEPGTEATESAEPEPSAADLRQAQPSSAEAPCAANATTLCLNNSRFKVQTQWTTTAGATGAGQAVSLTGDTGYFWFFTSNNVEMVIKVVDGRAVNGRFWVFAGGLTNVNVIITVTDTLTGAVRTYVNPQGAAFQPIQATDAFSG